MTRIKTVLTSLLILLLSGDLSAQEASEAASQPTFDRSQPPEPGEPSPFVLPSVREVTLSNGLMVTIVDRPGSPTLSVRLSVRAGRDSKPDNIAVPVLTARLLRDGTEAMDSEELANFIDRNGISFGFGVHTNSVIFAADALADKDTQVLTLLADLVGKASFPEDRVTARQAELVEDMQRVTMKGPMRLGAPFSLTILCARKKFEVDGPPEPMISPVRGLETSPSSSPLSAIACSIAMKL